MSAVIALALVAAGYAVGVARAGGWPWPRSLSFALGLGALAAALCTGIDGAADSRLSVHMVQHLLITMVAAPLIVAGAPIRLLLRIQSRAGRRRTSTVLERLRPFGHPPAALALFLAVVAVFHVPAVYDAAVRHAGLHAIEHAAFFWSAVALWVPLVGAEPVPVRLGPVGRVAVLMAAMAAMAAGGAVLAGADSLVYAAYAAPARRLGIDPVADQATAGGIMWMGAMVAMLPVLLALAWSGLAREERGQRVRDARAAGAPTP